MFYKLVAPHFLSTTLQTPATLGLIKYKSFNFLVSPFSNRLIAQLFRIFDFNIILLNLSVSTIFAKKDFN
ncbi:hypothetical protein J2X31_000985 [Flavobacterium arsenatis]|uniref:Uncharacterized protein n=1 Tax=Flavobacterium arsenatis TaxID=1484332 RepID=A0ABU1TLZ5_9FLAO|nr:hypothetical protein [Flavobacterium arsenatis]